MGSGQWAVDDGVVDIGRNGDVGCGMYICLTLLCDIARWLLLHLERGIPSEFYIYLAREK